jgi:predicted phage terminase large subunit-like protein
VSPALQPILPQASGQPNLIAKNFLKRISLSLAEERIPLKEFVRQSWPIIEPSRELQETWLVDLVIEYLTAVDMGQIKRLLINMQPRSLKSILVSVIWPDWSWTQKPWLRWIFASYSASLSTKHSLDRRRILESAWYLKHWGDVCRLEDDQNQKTEFQNTQRGLMASTSVGGSITGKGGSRIVIDDLINPQDAESKPLRETALDFYQRTLVTRLDDKETGSIVAVEQRTHNQDLSAHLLKEMGWMHLKVPATAPSRSVIVMPISGRKILRQEGDVVNPLRESPKVLASLKIAMGSRAFNAQFQQAPESEEGGYFQSVWWKFYKPAALPVVIRSCRAWDTAVKTGQENDNTCGCLIHQCENGYYVSEHFFKGRIQYPELKKRIQSEAAARPADYEVIEDASAGASVIQDLQSSSALPIIAFLSVKDKVTRASVVSPLVEAGKVFLPEDAPWVADFIDTMADFPGVEHDDEVDAFVIALMQLSGKANSGGAGLTVIANGEGTDED